MKSLDKSSKKRFGHVNATNANSMSFLLSYLHNKWKKTLKKTKIRAFEVFVLLFFVVVEKTKQKPRYFKTHFNNPDPASRADVPD